MAESALVSSADRFAGCMLGLALGDAFGAPHEGALAARLLWRAIGRTRTGELRFTDDTQMALDLAESLVTLGELDQDELARRFAASHRWSRGYGPGTATVLRRIRRGMPWQRANRSVRAEGSFGNGAAMRAPVVGLAFARDGVRRDAAAQATAAITYAHPLGIEGAQLIAAATAAALAATDATAIVGAGARACRSAEFTARLAIATEWLRAGERPRATAIAQQLGNGIAASASCVTALFVGAQHLRSPFEDLLATTIAIGGDVDTIAAMACAIWGAANGAAALPATMLRRLEQCARIRATAIALHDRFAASGPDAAAIAAART